MLQSQSPRKLMRLMIQKPTVKQDSLFSATTPEFIRDGLTKAKVKAILVAKVMHLSQADSTKPTPTTKASSAQGSPRKPKLSATSDR